MPTAELVPCPSEPVVMSMPGVRFMSQWLGRLVPGLLSVSNSSFGKKPFSASVAYTAGPACPLEQTSQSLSLIHIFALIQGYAEGLTAGVADDPEDRKFYCDTIADEADRMNKLVMQLLNLSKLELGAEQTYYEDIDLYALCRNAVEKTAVLCASRGLAVRYADTHVTIRTDGDLLEQVLMNYLSNAIRYTADGGRIEITAAYTENGMRLAIFNEGDGLPEDELPKIWEKFYRTDRARTREAGGTGIGLSLVRAIADTLHGSCGAENVEGGISFWFELPYFPERDAPA